MLNSGNASIEKKYGRRYIPERDEEEPVNR
jgi:hypothetical protein